EALRGLPQFCGGTHFRQKRPDVVTLPQWFKAHGYETRGYGKIYHGSPSTSDPVSWSVPAEDEFADGSAAKYVLPQNIDFDHPDRFAKFDSYECADVPDEAYLDGRVADKAVRALQELKDRPFFLAVGIRKPHLP